MAGNGPFKVTKDTVEPIPGEDYYFENGLLVMTAAYHRKRGYCCGSGCRHCPYLPRHQAGSSVKAQNPAES